MTVSLDDDFARFVGARWGDLEPVAHLVTLDREVARRVTVDVLADLQAEWARVVDDGAPAEAARRSVMAAALAAASSARRTGWPDAAPPDDETVAALVAVLVAATPVERATVAATVVWGHGVDESAVALGMPPGTVGAADAAVRSSLLAAHTAVRAARGWTPAEWQLDGDLSDAVEHALRGHVDPPDPAELVGRRRREVRRRSVLLGGAAAVSVGTLGAWGALEVLRGAAADPVAAPPGPSDPVWRSTATWPARGALAADDGLAEMVAATSPTSRVLFADDLPARRVVIAGTTGGRDDPGTVVRLWTGNEGAGPDTLAETPLVRNRVSVVDDVVPVVVPPPEQAGLPDLLLLAGPLVLTAEYSARVSYTRKGEAIRAWTEVVLRDGVATVPISYPVPPTLRVRLDGYDGAPVGATAGGLGPADLLAPLAESLVTALGPFVSACTGIPPSSLRHSVVLETRAPSDLLDPGAPDGGRNGRVAVVRTRLPNGALLRSVRAAGERPAPPRRLDLETVRPVPAEEWDQPFAVRLPSFRSSTGRFLVLAPGAAKAQLVAIASNVYPTSEVTPLVDGTGVLEVVDARLASVYLLVLWGPSGRRLGAWRQVFRRADPRDLWPRPR